MATKTTTVYSCDGCNQNVAGQAALRRFTLTESTLTRNQVATAKTDLCVDCEKKLHEKALPLWPKDEAEHMAGIVRG